MPRETGLFWWIGRWRLSTAYTDLSLEAQGAYRNLLDEARLRGGVIPNDERVLAKACGDARRWPKLRKTLLARFSLRSDGWHHATLDEMIRMVDRRADKQRHHRQRFRARLIAFWGRACVYCGDNTVELEVEHIVPVVRGGSDDLTNLTVACGPCNRRKNTQTATEFGHSDIEKRAVLITCG